ncbi:phage repressor protein CI [Kluyvera intermedia]|uniref:Phage repressor protein n=1 Tax=Kluyvera intermedia TaxID=61648 RepID=A0ABX6DPU7_KLUIN|nr:phage repressor protein CI [Kluyvera intermedia]QGH30828.1 phage repressor protein [Kluyvera intermedia]QGH39810.1 phage repressor protein [Kluyvera intermedia]
MDFNSGGKKVIERLVEAYGFTTRQALCDHLGVSKSTMATRYMRDIFPADWVLQCAMETGTTLEWIAFGKGAPTKSITAELITLECYDLHDGKLINKREYAIAQDLLPENLNREYVVNDADDFYIISQEETFTDGLWLVSIDQEFSVRNIFKLPGNRIRVVNERYSFECENDELTLNQKIKGIIKRRV